MSRFILDASIVLAWLLPDEFHPQASDVYGLLRRDGALVPQAWEYEVRHGLIKAERRRRITVEQSDVELGWLKRQDIIVDRDTDADNAFLLARKHLLSYYDALYLELAIREGAAIATIDGPLERAARAEALDVIPA